MGVKSNIHIPTTLDPEMDQLVIDLGEKPARWIYGALWLRLRQALAEDAIGPLRDALRAEVDAMATEATERCTTAIETRRPRAELDMLLDEKEILERLQVWLAPELPLPEMIREPSEGWEAEP